MNLDIGPEIFAFPNYSTLTAVQGGFYQSWNLDGVWIRKARVHEFSLRNTPDGGGKDDIGFDISCILAT